MRKYTLQVNGKDVTVELKSFYGEEAELELNGEVFKVQVKNVMHTALMSERIPIEAGARKYSSTAPVAAPRHATPAAGKGSVLAPIPGVVLSVYVEVGAKVRSGEPLLKMEAMKMDHEISATLTGTVSAVLAQVGDSVLQGHELVHITPEA
ncbi:MAG: biotin/lipoyl-containing protein [Desulfuromonadaceae bacterium]|jgi:biotin carboxyl carrier protein|nr:hypothetical protein [Desulfuromonas sp.]MDY0185331.1 biotin/lipoyl-containing protein [Desulfuromonadaceae bacterium]